MQRTLSKSFQDSRWNSKTGLSTFKEKRSQVHTVKSADNTESKLNKQKLMTCLNSQCVGFNMEENCTNQLLCSVEWEWSASAQRKGQTCCSMRAHMHGCSKRWDVSPRGRPRWASQLCFSSIEEVPAATNAVPDHGVNSLIFNAALHYAQRTRLFQRHPLTWRRRRGGKECET